MAQTVSILLDASDTARLKQIVSDRSRPHKHVQRARIVLLSGERLSVLEVARRAGVSRPAVWRWQQRFAEEGVDGLLHDKTRKPGTPPIGKAVVARIVALTCTEPPGAVTHWTGRAMAEAAGVSLTSIQRIWPFIVSSRTCPEQKVNIRVIQTLLGDNNRSRSQTSPCR